jgi:hypothetical protein
MPMLRNRTYPITAAFVLALASSALTACALEEDPEADALVDQEAVPGNEEAVPADEIALVDESGVPKTGDAQDMTACQEEQHAVQAADVAALMDPDALALFGLDASALNTDASAAACHWHYIDEQPVGLHSFAAGCDPWCGCTIKTLPWGAAFCQRGDSGRSCGAGTWMVLGHDSSGTWGWVRIRALNGH